MRKFKILYITILNFYMRHNFISFPYQINFDLKYCKFIDFKILNFFEKVKGY